MRLFLFLKLSQIKLDFLKYFCNLFTHGGGAVHEKNFPFLARLFFPARKKAAHSTISKKSLKKPFLFVVF